MVLPLGSDREKEIRTNSLFFDSGQANLDICLSFDCLGSSFGTIEHIGRVKGKTHGLWDGYP